ncbi:MAG: hypothetical protein WC750_02435 [Patescibacteria group bacterium]
MNCTLCSNVIQEDECMCPKCFEPMICENKICHCNCGAALPENKCLCVECANQNK